jgi:hypothetical protein
MLKMNEFFDESHIKNYLVSQKAMKAMFSHYYSHSQCYQKIGTTFARLAYPGELITTILDGYFETKNIAAVNEVVLKGQKGEEHLIGYEKFHIRYSVDKPLSSEYQSYSANGTCIAFEYTGDSIEFQAAWNEKMIINSGDFLATTDTTISEVYRIERDAFFKTYKIINVE